MAKHTYVVYSVPSGCTKYQPGDPIELDVPEPPPEIRQVSIAGPCNGMWAMLDEYFKRLVERYGSTREDSSSIDPQV